MHVWGRRIDTALFIRTVHITTHKRHASTSINKTLDIYRSHLGPIGLSTDRSHNNFEIETSIRQYRLFSKLPDLLIQWRNEMLLVRLRELVLCAAAVSAGRNTSRSTRRCLFCAMNCITPRTALCTSSSASTATKTGACRSPNSPSSGTRSTKRILIAHTQTPFLFSKFCEFSGRHCQCCIGLLLLHLRRILCSDFVCLSICRITHKNCRRILTKFKFGGDETCD